MKVMICTCTWNNLEFTKEFIRSLSCIKSHFELLIWDNGSTDGTVEYLKHKPIFLAPFLKDYKYVLGNANFGLPIAWNYGLSMFEQSDCDVFMSCDNDTRLTSTINRLFKFAVEHPEFGLVCPNIMDRDTDVNFLEEIAETITDINIDKLDVGGLNGPCRVITKETLKRVGYYDNQFAFSFDDMDYHQRVLKAGMKTAVHYGSAIWHHNHASTDVNKESHNKIYYERFQKKHG